MNEEQAAIQRVITDLDCLREKCEGFRRSGAIMEGVNGLTDQVIRIMLEVNEEVGL